MYIVLIMSYDFLLAFKSIIQKRYCSRMWLFSRISNVKQNLLPLEQFRVFQCSLSQNNFSDVFSEQSKQHFLKSIEKLAYKDKRKSKKEAAVLVPLCIANGEPSVLLTLRSWTMGRNKGDASFPGGMRETSDKDVVDLALRETKEEIGLSPKVAQIWTVLPSIPRDDFRVTPVIAFIGDVKVEDCIVNPSEVDRVFTLTLKSLCDPKNFYYTEFKSGYSLPLYIVGEHRVWGMTAGILHHFLSIFLPKVYTNKLPRPMMKKQKYAQY